MARAESRGAAHFPFVANVALAPREMALWDISGKALGAPVHQLLGGSRVETVPFYWHVNGTDDTAASAIDHAREGLDRGFSTLYVKGSADPRHDLELMLELRKAVGHDVALRLDPNEGWHYRDCAKLEGLLREVDLEFLEQPFGMRATREAQLLRRRTHSSRPTRARGSCETSTTCSAAGRPT